MADVKHVDWLREGVQQWNKRRKKVFFRPDLSGIDFKDFLPPDFREKPKASMFFEKINLEDANLSGADLSNLNFASAKFDRSNLREANLSLTNFRRASFFGADLSYSVAENASFVDANFRQAEIALARVSVSNFEGALLFETNFSDEQKEMNRTAAAIVSFASWEIKKSLNRLVRTIISPEASGSAEKQERKQRDIVDVLYATNRAPRYERGQLVGFTGDRGESIFYGVCEVTIPDSQSVGSIGSRIWRRGKVRNEVKEAISALIDYSELLYWNHWQQTYNKMIDKAEPTVFVHGYNNSFVDAVLRAARICSVLGLGQGIGLFSWPSRSGVRNYVPDQNAADASKWDLVEFLENFIVSHPARRVNLVAHSTGCRLLTHALEALALKDPGKLAAVSNVIMVAADIDIGTMAATGPHFFPHVKRATSYTSANDLALLAAEKVAKYPRVGRLPPVYVLNGMDTIVVEGDDGTFMQHSYIESSRLISDMFYLIKAKLPPSSRHALQQVRGASGIYWRMV